MTTKAVLLRFFLAYTALIIVTGLVMNHFGIKGNTGINFGILAGCIFWVCGSFGKKNGRYFSNKEKTVVVVGLIAIDLVLQLVFGAAALSQSPTGIHLGALVFAVGFIGILHTIAIYVFVGMTKKMLVKQGVLSG